MDLEFGKRVKIQNNVIEEITYLIKKTDMEFIRGVMEIIIKEISLMISDKDKVNFIRIIKLFIKENGIRANKQIIKNTLQRNKTLLPL